MYPGQLLFQALDDIAKFALCGRNHNAGIDTLSKLFQDDFFVAHAAAGLDLFQAVCADIDEMIFESLPVSSKDEKPVPIN